MPDVLLSEFGVVTLARRGTDLSRMLAEETSPDAAAGAGAAAREPAAASPEATSKATDPQQQAPQLPQQAPQLPQGQQPLPPEGASVWQSAQEAQSANGELLHRCDGQAEGDLANGQMGK